MASAWEISDVAFPKDVGRALAALVGDSGSVFAIPDPQLRHAEDPAPRYLIAADDPLAVLTQTASGPATVAFCDGRQATDASGWRLWARLQADLPTFERPSLPLTPGWLGYVGFEAARQLERLPGNRRDPLTMPMFRLALYDAAIVLDLRQQRGQLLRATGLRKAIGLAEAGGDALAARWSASLRKRGKLPVGDDFILATDLTPMEYRDRVRQALDYIAAGDIYQVNLCQRLRLQGLAPPADVFRTLFERHPSPYAAFLNWHDGAIVSTSPELMLRVDPPDVLTSPIKGTRPRGEHDLEDHGMREALWRSEKDRAELNMIIDLHRNDLGRVCTPGSVQVRTPRRIERHPRVFHTVADIAGRMRDDASAIDALAACFPAGSISGVPKIRALEIIDELEPVARGAYTGAIGTLGLDGRAHFSVAIRILQMRPGEASLYVGGGIVADSDPLAEYEETLAKAAGICAALRPKAHPLRIGGS